MKTSDFDYELPRELIVQTPVVDYGLKRSVVGTTLKLGEGMSGRVAQTGEPMIVDDYRTWAGRVEVCLRLFTERGFEFE